MLAEGRLSAPAPSEHPAQVLAAYLLLALRHEVLGQDVLGLEARKAAGTLGQVFPAAFVARLRTLMDEVPGLTSTVESVDLARRIRRLIEEEAKDPPRNGSERTGGSDEQNPAGAGSAATSDESEGTSAQDGSAGQGPTRGQGPGATGGAAQASAPQPDTGDGTDSPDATDAGDDVGAGSTKDADGFSQRDALAAVLSAGAGDWAGDLFTEVGRLLGAQPGSTSETRLPLPEECAGNALAGMHLLSGVQAEWARLSARLQGLVQASRSDRPRPVRSGRRLDPRRLHRVAVADERIFARKAHRVAPNTAVHLLVDLSGSMAAAVDRRDGSVTTRTECALESALALALALDGIAGVRVAVTGFPGRAGRPDRVTRMVRPGQSPQACAGAFVQGARGGTPMAQALWYAAAELLACREERRMLMVLTDGEPDDTPEALRLLGLCRQAGIEAVGVGIGVDVRHLFPTAIEVRGAKDLKRELFGVAEQLLVGAAA